MVYGFVEVKATNKSLYETEQVKGQNRSVTHYLYTNGLVWKYYKDGDFKWEIILALYENKKCSVMCNIGRISIDSYRFKELVDEVKRIKWS